MTTLLDRSARQPTFEARLRCFLRDLAGHMANIEPSRTEPVATFNDVRMISDAGVAAAYAAAAYADMFRRIRRQFSPPWASRCGCGAMHARTCSLRRCYEQSCGCVSMSLPITRA